MQASTCAIALKEWSVSCRALEEGRQILLLRKGGLLDAEGIFNLEYSRFWLAPTKWHQDAGLLKPSHHDLLQSDVLPARGVLRFSAWAEVVQLWSLDAREAAAEDKLMRLDHIWSERYLDVRLGYRPEKPIVILALRVHVLATPHLVEARPEYSGCRSWIELDMPLDTCVDTHDSRAAPGDEEFKQQLNAARQVLGDRADV
jgi:hypothetical protein